MSSSSVFLSNFLTISRTTSVHDKIILHKISHKTVLLQYDLLSVLRAIELSYDYDLPLDWNLCHLDEGMRSKPHLEIMVRMMEKGVTCKVS